MSAHREVRSSSLGHESSRPDVEQTAAHSADSRPNRRADVDPNGAGRGGGQRRIVGVERRAVLRAVAAARLASHDEHQRHSLESAADGHHDEPPDIRPHVRQASADHSRRRQLQQHQQLGVRGPGTRGAAETETRASATAQGPTVHRCPRSRRRRFGIGNTT